MIASASNASSVDRCWISLIAAERSRRVRFLYPCTESARRKRARGSALPDVSGRGRSAIAENVPSAKFRRAIALELSP
jgi:hypothetical protein